MVVAKDFNRSALKACVGKHHEGRPLPLNNHRDKCRVVAANNFNQSALKACIGRNHEESPTPLIKRPPRWESSGCSRKLETERAKSVGRQAPREEPLLLNAHRDECRVDLAKSFNRSALKACIGKHHEESPSPLNAHRDESRVVVAKGFNRSALKACVGKRREESPSPLNAHRYKS